MNIRFLSSDPRERARPTLDDILSKGVDQIAIACAFVTGGGATVLSRHAKNLSQADSFLVAAWEYPTDGEALAQLHRLVPGHIYLHLGSKTPVEKRVGRGLMHSKVFFGRRGRNCWLWVGSHNLTASAVQGVNLEAALAIEGTVDEEPFRNALNHLNQCRDEAIAFDPFHLPEQPGSETTLVIHAEQHVQALQAPPWHVHLLPMTTDFDNVMRPPGDVWLFLYPPGSLDANEPRPPAQSAYSGTITALNFTQHHPRRGIPADWRPNYVIDQRNRVFALVEDLTPNTSPSQCIFRIESQQDPKTVWLSQNPRPKDEKIVGVESIEPVDDDLRSFFTKRSLRGHDLVHREYRSLRRSVKVSEKEAGSQSAADLAARFGVTENTSVSVTKSRKADPFAFLYRAKYRT